MKKVKIHFIGILGSGCFRAALAAKQLGFEVSGCDGNPDSPYAKHIDDAGISVAVGHDAKHIEPADIVAVSPALIQQRVEIPEVSAARDAGKLSTWQDFCGTHILPKIKNVAAVMGTHGKTTVSSMLGFILKRAGLNPMCFIGSNVPQLDDSVCGDEWAVVEADEYANNFKTYRPDFIVLNNLEMEHPEYFRDYGHYKQIFRDFLSAQSPESALVYNSEDKNIPDILDSFSGRKIPFSPADFTGAKLNLPGAHNIMNAAAASSAARAIKIPDDVINGALADFRGAGHRLEKIFENRDIVLFDDYAHHHSQAAAGIKAIRESYPARKIIVVYEPHQISRYAQNTKETLDALNAADVAFITAFWLGREAHLAVPDAAGDIIRHGAKNVSYIPDPDEVAKAAFAAAKGPSAILVMGAGRAWKIAGKIKELVSVIRGS
ncbi:MAG: Mur ligase domain-containing protein [Rickettsiales bacterium]|nr:Mur ligase domain-containing protein [Rickettsiales bacterium]